MLRPPWWHITTISGRRVQFGHPCSDLPHGHEDGAFDTGGLEFPVLPDVNQLEGVSRGEPRLEAGRIDMLHAQNSKREGRSAFTSGAMTVSNSSTAA